MILLSEKTYKIWERAIKYPSITGGRGVRVDRQPGGGIQIQIPPTGDGTGVILGPPYIPDDPSGDESQMTVLLPPYTSDDPFAPDGPS